MVEPIVTLSLPDRAATQRLGNYLGQHLPAGTVLLLAGDLGSGKTTLVQGLGLGLGTTESVDSPTFTLVNEYLDGRVPLYHLDLYRLDPSEVEALHPELFWDPGETQLGIVAIEWAERLPTPPADFLRIELGHRADGGRTAGLQVVGQGNLTDALSTVVRALQTEATPTLD
jgi:tRNA threonylcarbamoyladenosine biosynthesis protein TsaE